MELQEGDFVLCNVERIEKTTVFVKIIEGGENIDGSIIVSEIAPGRIRNLRDYVVPNKKIVCKILRISSSGNVELSLRRVTPKEKREVMEGHSLEKSYEKIIKGILGEKAKEIIKEISKKGNLRDFIRTAKENTKKFDEYFDKKDAEKLIEILSAQKKKKIQLKKEFSFFSAKPNGIELVKNTLEKIKDVEVIYISAGNYAVKTESEEIKSADKKLREILLQVEDYAKKNGMQFEIKEK